MAAAEILRAPRPADLLVAGVTGATMIALLLSLPVLTASVEDAPPLPAVGSPVWWAVAITIVVQTAALPWGRHAPRAVPLCVSAATLLLAAAMPAAALDIAAIAIPVAVFLASRATALALLWPALAASAVVFGTAGTVNGIGAEGSSPLLAIGESVAQVALLFGVPLLLGGVLRARRDARDAERRELRALTRERDALVDATVARERTAMARELHDIAAHHLSGIALMASAVERQVATDPDAARLAARQIRVESTAVLQNLRRVVGMLRVDGVAERSVENFASVPDLVAAAAAERGLDVQLRVQSAEDGRALGQGIGPLAQLAAYRMIQESLANAALHAPGARCLVEMDDTDADEVRVLVRNEAPGASVGRAPSGGGFGLIGMRERAELVGAALEFGPTREGGWEVRLVLTRDVT